MADIPETHVLAIASHVTYGYVGNTMATFVMQTLGCEVSAINTVHFSNHTGYKQFKGRRTPAEEIAELYQGLKQSRLDDADVLLSGYCPSAAVVQEVGKIARELKFKSTMRPGSFLWVLDPVMGDDGSLYVHEDTVPAYKSLLRHADLILPNQFEAELLSGVSITDEASLIAAVQTLHREHRIPHIIVTSVRFKAATGDSSTVPQISVIGSSARSDLTPRLFKVTVPALPVYFSGTGDMFAALTVARLREASAEAGLLQKPSWQAPDDVEAEALPLARATQKVLASMHAVLERTAAAREREVERIEGEVKGQEGGEKRQRLRLTKAAEVRVVQSVDDLRRPRDLDRFRPRILLVTGDSESKPEETPEESKDEGLETKTG